MPKVSKEQILANLDKVQGKSLKTNDVTLVGVGEAGLSMFTGLGGAFAGTVIGTFDAIKEGDINAYAPAFEYINEQVNNVVQYEPRTNGGEAAIKAIEGLWTDFVSEPVDEYLVDPNLENNNPLVAAIGKASGEGLPMFLGLKGSTVVKPLKIGGKYALNKGLTITDRVVNKTRGKPPAAREALVDVETGKPVTDGAPISDKGSSFNAFKEFVKVAQDPSINPHEAIGRLLKPAFYKPVQVLRDWGTPDANVGRKGSPTLLKMADAIYAPTKADKVIKSAVKTDLVEATSTAQGRFMQAWDQIIEPFKGRLNTVKKVHGEAITRGLRTGRVQKQYRDAVLQHREMLDVFVEKYVRPVLPDIGHLPNYVPQVWNVPHILKYPSRAKSFFVEKMKMSPDAAETTIRRIVESEGSPEFYDTSGRLSSAADFPDWAGRIRQRGGASKSSAEQSRKIHVPDEALPYAEEFLLNNIGDLMPAYIRNVTKRVEYSRIFGPKEELLNSSVSKAIKELGIENNVKMIEDVTADVYGLADALQGKYRPIKSLAINKWNRRLANYETVLHLGLVSLASLPELAAPAVQFGFVPKAYVKGFAYALIEATAAAERIIRGKRSIPKLKSGEALESMGAISLSPLQSWQAARFTNISSHFTSRFMHMTGLELLTDAQKVIAYETLSHVIKRNAKAVAEGKKGKKAKFYEEQLRELGIEPDVAAEWYRDGMPKEGRLSDLVENAKYRGQRWAITMPSSASKPLLFSDPHFTNVLLFKSFTATFSTVFMKRALKNLKVDPMSAKAQTIGAMAAATAIAYYTQFLREMISGYDTGMSQSERLAAAFDRTAFTGPYTYAYNLINPYRYGFTDSSAKRLFNLLGPAGSDLGKVMDVMINPALTKRQRARELAKLVPIANVTGESKEITEDMIYDLLP